VPCRGQFYQYIHWHNNAVETTKKLGIPRLDIHYEDYHYDLDGLQTRMVKFLDLSKTGEKTIPFRWNGGYSDYYTDDQRRAIATLIRYLSADDLLKVLDRYLTEDRIINGAPK